MISLLSDLNAEQILAIHEATNELKQIQSGKLKGTSAQNLLNEL